MAVIAIPNPHFPPGEAALAEADLVLDSLAELTVDAVGLSPGLSPEGAVPSD
jgi:hypothetical protein